MAFARRAMGGHRVRTALTLSGIAVGVAAVVALTGLGEGARRYVTEEFRALGSNLVIVIPGRVETTGASPLFGASERDLTIGDAQAIARRVRGARYISPISLGNATVEYAGRGRSVSVVGATPEYFRLRDLRVDAGVGLPPVDPRQGMRVCVIGRTVQQELFREENPLGKIILIGQWRFRVIGVLAHKGSLMGWDIDDLVFVPVASGLEMFNRTGLFRILLMAGAHEETDRVIQDVRKVLRERHDGNEDFTVVSEGAMLSALDAILATLSVALAGIAAISLSVAGIGVMNVMLISVAERTAEVGLLKALGAADSQVLAVFLAEAATLSGAGGAIGVAAGYGIGALVGAWLPGFDPTPPVWAAAAGWATAVGVGIVFGLWPARRAARLDPVAALAGARG